MKRVLLLMAVLATTLFAGCVQVETYDDPGQAIDIGVKEQFVIALGANPGSTGYSWQESHDATMLELVEKTYEAEAKPGLVGAGGVEYFRFKALKTGRTEVTLVYKRSWEAPTPQDLTKVFTVHIR